LGSRLTATVWVALLLAAAVVLFHFEPASAQPSVVAGRVGPSEINLDGALDEPAWAEAGVIEDLTQQEPHPGAPTPYATRVLLLTDGRSLFIGFRCVDPEPRKISVHTLQRDGELRGDDAVAVVLDTFGDGRRGYMFEINAAAARSDGLISGPERVSRDWDGIWDARTRRTSDGWTAEIAIPAQSVRFDPLAEAWGFNVERRIARDRITLRWASPTLDSRLEDLRRAGRLLGLRSLRQGMGLSVSPYGLGRRNGDLDENRSVVQGDVGLDVTYNFTPDLSGVLTVNTDFAETEVDTRQVNLTRFPLFFPEKRAFFLEGADYFSFGSGLRRDFIPFFSRRIGLYEGRQVPLLAGAKLLGRIGDWRIAGLDVVTGGDGGTERANLFAGRVTYDVGRNLTLGSIFTNGDPDGVHGNTLGGLDVLWQTSSFRGDKNFSLGAWAAASRSDSSGGRRYGWGLKLDYPNDLWDLYFVYKEFGDGLDPALGFLPRPGTKWVQAGGAFSPRPSAGLFDWVRQFYFELHAGYVADLDGRVESWRVFTAPFNARTESGEHVEANVVPRFERLDSPFEISEGVEIPPGKYVFTRYRVEAQSSSHRPWRVGGTLWFGPFYDGRLSQLESFLAYTAFGGRLSLEVSGEYNDGHLPHGNFVQRLLHLKCVLAFTPDLILSSYTQYDSDSRDVGTNTRLRWTLRPGNDLYVVWNHDWEHPEGSAGAAGFVPRSDQLVIKLRWTFRV